MAFDLKAILKLDDKFSDPMRKIARQVAASEKAMKGLNDAAGRTGTATGKLRDSMGRFANEGTRSIGKMKLSLGGLVGAIGGVAAAYAAVEGAKKVFESTVLEAAKFEQSNVIIGAMFDDKALSKQYTDMVDRFAVNSPIMNSQEMYGSSKSFIQTSKNVKDLEKMWSLTERMAAIDPIQGVEGSVFALRELFSGDSQSMVERFEMPRKIMNEIKKLPLEQQLSALDKYFNKIGMTTKLVDEMGGTTLGLWARVREQFSLVLRDMGAPSLEVISGFLTKVIGKLEGGSLDRFANVGAKWIKNILTGLTNSAMGIYEWFDALTSSEQFKKKTTLASQIKFVIEDVFNRFSSWMETKGKDQLTRAAAFMLEVIAGGIDAAQEPLQVAAKSIGGALGSGIVEAMKTEFHNSMVGFLDSNPLGKINNWLGQDLGYQLAEKWAGVTGYSEKKSKKSSKSPGTSKSSKKNTYRPIAGQRAHNGGLDYVPYDSYPALLHKGETVLPREEANNRRNGRGGGITIAKLADQIIIREDADIDRITDGIVRKLISAGEAGA